MVGAGGEIVLVPNWSSTSECVVQAGDSTTVHLPGSDSPHGALVGQESAG